MRCNSRHESTVIAVASRRAEGAVLAFADLLTAHCNARITPVRMAAEAPIFDPLVSPATDAGSGFIRDAINRIASAEKVGLIVSEWLKEPRDMQDALWLAQRLGVPAVFIRNPEFTSCNRVLVATAGGPNVFQQMWVAREMACALGLPVHLLRIAHPGGAHAATTPASDSSTAALDACSCRLLHVEARWEVKTALNVGEAIAASVREGDLLILGAPSALRLSSGFAGSLPNLVASRVAAPMILLSAPPDNRLDLRRLFWGRLIDTDLRSRDKTHAIAALIKNLAIHNQIPRSSLADILDRALRREAIMSTAVDCETAFPHVTLRGFFGVVGSMAICADGVDFDGPDGRPARFLYLLITPDGLYDEYLATLAMIARRMINPEVRQALLTCRSPAQVLDILDPRPPCRQGTAYEAEELAEPHPIETLQR